MSILGDASKDDIERLLNKPGEAVGAIVLNRLARETVVRLETISGNIYLLRVIDPIGRRVEFYRHNAHGEHRAGYRGERELEPRLAVGSSIAYHDPARRRFGRVDEIVSITLLI